MSKHYTKGTVLLMSLTYEVPVTIEEDGDYSDRALEELGTHALLQSGEMDGHLTESKVLSENDAARPDVTKSRQVSHSHGEP